MAEWRGQRMPGYSAHLKAAHQPPKNVFSTYYVPGHLLPQQWRRHRLYLGGAEAAAVAVVARADGKHASQPLLLPPTGLPGLHFLLGLQTPDGLVNSGQVALRCSGFYPVTTPSPSSPASSWHRPPGQTKELCLPLQAWDPGCPQGHSVELTIKGTYSNWPGEWRFSSFREYVWFFTGHANTACGMYDIPTHTARRTSWGDTGSLEKIKLICPPSLRNSTLSRRQSVRHCFSMHTCIF